MIRGISKQGGKFRPASKSESSSAFRLTEFSVRFGITVSI